MGAFAAWLGRFFAAFIPSILEWVYGKTVGAIQAWQAARARKKEIEDAAAATRAETEAAQSKEERDRAAQDAFRKH